VSRPRLRVAVVGAGWAGLAAAVEATTSGYGVTLYEMAAFAGGRARSVPIDPLTQLDNGQHILIGAYTQTLRLMRVVGADPERLLHRRPLELLYPDGSGLRMPRGPVHLAFAWAVARTRGWSWRDRLALLAQALAWLHHGMQNPGVQTVDELSAQLPTRVRADLIDPLCIATLNTPASEASATVFLRVLADALFGGRGSSDLMLPRVGLSDLFPTPATTWLAAQGVACRLGQRVQRIDRSGDGWRLDDEVFDSVILACSAVEASRLAAAANPDWSRVAAALHYEPIATVYLRRGATPCPSPMVALRSSAPAPAQFAFDLELLGQHRGLVAFVVSGARSWIDRGMPALIDAVRQQAAAQLPESFERSAPVVRATMERRATFACTPALQRLPMAIAPALYLAGDYAQGPYPATLEGAVRSGIEAAHALAGNRRGGSLQ
jgi:hydroxysqualene dehydroxylase